MNSTQSTTLRDAQSSHPTISMESVQYEDGSWGVNLYMTSLASEAHADAAREYMARQFCGDEIKAQG